MGPSDFSDWRGGLAGPVFSDWHGGLTGPVFSDWHGGLTGPTTARIKLGCAHWATALETANGKKRQGGAVEGREKASKCDSQNGNPGPPRAHQNGA